MDGVAEQLRKQVAALQRVMLLARSIKVDSDPCQIDEGLFLGSIAAASNKTELKSLKITHVLTVANLMGPAHPNDFTYKVIEVMDKADTNIAQYFDECFNFIEEAKRLGGGVLVHCFMGRSRSVTIVTAYMMKKHGMSVSQALEHVKSRRENASPNHGFVLQLQNFEKSLQDEQNKDEKNTE